MTEKRCCNCLYYRKATINYGECMFKPPGITTVSVNIEHPDSWQRPAVWLDDFCGNFTPAKTAAKRGRPPKNKAKTADGEDPQGKLDL